MLLPHYGVVEGEELQVYLERSEAVVKETAEQIVTLFRAGKSAEEILEILTEHSYPAHVREVYPIDAYRLNTSIIIELVRRELEQTIRTLLSTLNERQQRILKLHFGMEDGTCYSLEEIGRMLGISKERARQIEKQAMDKLQKNGASLGLEDFLNE